MTPVKPECTGFCAAEKTASAFYGNRLVFRDSEPS